MSDDSIFSGIMVFLLILVGFLIGILVFAWVVADTDANCTHFATVPVVQCTTFDASRNCVTWKQTDQHKTVCVESPW